MSCSICNKETGLFSKKKLSNGEICSDCLKKIPFMLHNQLSGMSVSKVAEIIDYEEELKKETFLETSSYKKIHLDDLHGLFSITDKPINEMPENVFSILDLSNISICCDNAKANKSNVTCDVYIVCEFERPKITFKEIIGRNVVCDIKQIDNKNVIFDEPKELKMFRSIFNQAIQNTYEDYQRKAKWEFASKKDHEYFEAKSIFLLDDGYTADEVKVRRKLLMKVFHPDQGDVPAECASKINKAYKLLLQQIDQFDPSELLR